MNNKQSGIRHYYYGLAVIAVLSLPPILWRYGLSVTPGSYHQLPQVLRLFGVVSSIALLLTAYLELRWPGAVSFERVLPMMLGTLIGFHFLGILSADHSKTFDYSCYENAACAILRRQNPYLGCYLYPPLMAQVMACLCEAIAWSASLTGLQVPEATLWNAVFYLFQGVQFILVLLTYFLGYKFARALGMTRVHSSTLIAVLLVFNQPLIRTIQEKQVNLLVLDAIWIAVLFASKHPLVSGWAIALGAHVKLYPAALVIPGIVTSRMKLVAGAVLGAAGIVLLLSALEGDAQLWIKYAGMLISFPEQTNPGNISLNNCLRNGMGAAAAWTGMSASLFYQIARGTAILAKCAIFFWFCRRFLRRERTRNGMGILADSSDSNDRRFLGHAMDILAMSLIVSPVLWDHHFVLLMPLVTWAIAARGRIHPWEIGLGTFLMLGQTGLDMFPLNCHRLAGLFMLLWCARPEALDSRCDDSAADGKTQVEYTGQVAAEG